MRPGLSPRCAGDGTLGWLQSRSDCLFSSHRRLHWLQALRNCLSHWFLKRPRLSRGWNYPQYGSSLLKENKGLRVSIVNTLKILWDSWNRGSSLLSLFWVRGIICLFIRSTCSISVKSNPPNTENHTKRLPSRECFYFELRCLRRWKVQKRFGDRLNLDR